MEYTDEELLLQLQKLLVEIYSPNDDAKFRENLGKFLSNLTASKINVDDASGGTDDQTAAEVPFTAVGSISATNVQAALAELDGDKNATNGYPGLTALFNLQLKNEANTFTSLIRNLNTAIRTYLLPDASGTIALTSNIPAAIPKVVQFAVSDETTALTTGTNKVKFRMPYAMTVTAVRASLGTAQTSGSTLTIDINETGATILGTKLTIDNTETTSVSAAVAATITDAALADDAEITVDIDQVGDGTAIGLKITLIGN